MTSYMVVRGFQRACRTSLFAKTGNASWLKHTYCQQKSFFGKHLASSSQYSVVTRDRTLLQQKSKLLPSPRLCRGFFEDRKTTALTVLSDLKHLKSSPMPALVLGLSGVIPFAAAPVYMIGSGTFLAGIAFGQAAYGAAILSFLGGVRWGLTIPEESSVRPDWLNLGYSVTLPLVAWVGLLLPSTLSILTLIGGLTGAAYFDTAAWGYPPWFKALRFLLSLVAILSLWTTLICQLILKKEDTDVKPSDSAPVET